MEIINARLYEIRINTSAKKDARQLHEMMCTQGKSVFERFKIKPSKSLQAMVLAANGKTKQVLRDVYSHPCQ